MKPHAKRLKPNLSVRRLRKTLDLTQAGLANLVGVSRDAVASWESGRNQITRKMARHISWVTGADAECLLKGDGELRISSDRKPWRPSDPDQAKEYTFQDFKNWTAELSNDIGNFGLEATEHLVGRVIECLGAALRADTAGKKAHLSTVCDALNDCFDEVESHCRLLPHLEEMRVNPSWELQSPKWLQHLSKQLRKIFGRVIAVELSNCPNSTAPKSVSKIKAAQTRVIGKSKLQVPH